MEQAPFHESIAQGPENGSAFWIKAEDGINLRAGLWQVSEGGRGTILIFPGRTEYVELQGRTATVFADQGYATLTIDWRGHGLSDRLIKDAATLHVDQFSDYQLDVSALVQFATDLDLPKPWFLVGNSMGGAIGLRALTEGLPVSACSFMAPMWRIKMLALQRAIALPVSFVAQVIGKGTSYVPGHNGENYILNNPFEGNRITSDPDSFDYWLSQARAHPELQTAGSSLRWLNQSLSESNRLVKLPAPNIPSVAFCGDQDGIVSLDAIKDRMSSWRGGRFHEVQGAKHALLLEQDDVRKLVIGKTIRCFEDARPL